MGSPWTIHGSTIPWNNHGKFIWAKSQGKLMDLSHGIFMGYFYEGRYVPNVAKEEYMRSV